ncbi:hypothetical protein CMI40_01260 [Candidatus Pacearchaeota archaeon]|jgi:hypothetical protein|nr:hypothetical protein [Candidatus Pacearchaeota archaeon]|tara:strand:- start:1523 stop:1828 length:306 start_codon:yes stop_codon:yes gene_type:complete
MTIEKIRKKFKPCKNANLARIVSEIALIAPLLLNPIEAQKSNFKVHKVPVKGIEYFVADAKYLNKYTNQSGRGNLRYLFDSNKDYMGLALEKDNGGYKIVA